MTQHRTDILFPPGRLVAGSLYAPRDKDAEGKALVIKNGPDAGKPRVDYFIAVAIPKQAGHTHWAQSDWGAKIYATAAASHPQAYQSPAYAFKISDGDSTIPNRNGRKPCDNEGWPGHWVVKFSGGYAPKVYQQPQPGVYNELSTPDAVKCGYWVQVSGNVAGNGSAQQPGVYLNHGMVLFVKPDTEIRNGPDAATAFAGAAVSAALPGVGAVAPLPFTPPVAPAAPVAVVPNPAFLAPPAAVPLPVPMGLPVPPVPVAAPPARVMTAKAQGATYESMVAVGWTDETLRQHGYMA